MVTFAVTVSNERDDIEILLNQLGKIRYDLNPEILIQYDIDTATPEVIEYITEFKNTSELKTVITGFSLNFDFASFKNNLFNYATMPWIFQIDADEQLQPKLAENLPYIIRTFEEEDDVVLISRINVLHSIDLKKIREWGWSYDIIGGYDAINFPDLQSRLYKNDPYRLRWVSKVHERIVGGRTKVEIIDPEYSILHIKSMCRQIKQNEFYKNNF